STAFYLKGNNPGHYMVTVVGWIDSNANQVLDQNIPSEANSVFRVPLNFDVQPPQQFMDRTWMQQSGVWFPEITLDPTAGPVKTKVTVSATAFPAGANITHLRFAGTELPIPAGIVSDNNGAIALVFNVPGTFGIGNYMVEVEASKAGLPSVFIAKPFFVQDAGVSFKLNVTPGFLPGVRQGASGSTTVSIEATSETVTAALQVDGLPPGVTASFGSSNLTAAPGGSASTVLTITTRASTPPGHYPLTIRGISGAETRLVPFGISIMPPANFQMPKLNLQPDFTPAGYLDKKFKVTFSGAGFPASQNVTSLQFGSQTIAIPDNLTTDANGSFTGVFQMPTGLNAGTYDVRVAVASGSGGSVFDSRPFSIRGSDARFILQLSPPYLPPIVQGGQGTILINTMSVGTT
ncbi:MAG: hypothetical protein Q7K41_05245, partial [Dehalococcoidales bacterium]|nr:hypothetical protein [Dehalococcoidales bacterium]